MRTWFTAIGLDSAVVEGAEARAAQDNYGPGTANRVVFAVAPDVEIVPPRMIGEDDTGTRQLLNANVAIEVSIAAYDASAPERDLAHRALCLAIYEKVVQGVQRAYWGGHEWRGARWNDTRKHGLHGRELVALLVVNVPVHDAGDVLATPSPVPGEPKPVNET